MTTKQTNIPIPDAVEKIVGAARYPADVELPGMLHARPVLSPLASAHIVHIETAQARAAPGVVSVLTAANLPTAGKPARDRNSAILAADRVLWHGQPVALVLAETEVAAADAARLVEVEYEPDEPITDPEEALGPDSRLVHPTGMQHGGGASADIHAGAAAGGGKHEATSGNVTDTTVFERGDVESGFGQADEVVELTLRTESVHQAYLEPHACVAGVDPVDGTLVVYTSTQGLFSTRNGIASLLGLGRDEVRVVPMKVGGGFGAKYGIYEPLVGAAAIAAGRPVRLVVTRSEDFVSTTPAPATVFEVRMGGTRDGRLTALEATMILESGAFSSGLAGLAANLFASTYRCDNISIVAHEVLVNKSMVGAYRAPGAPQAAFAAESAIDELTRALDVDPLEFRLGIACETGDPMADGDRWPSIGIRDTLLAAAAHPLWVDRHSVPEGHGVGMAVGGWPGGTAPAAAVCRADTDGSIYLHVGSIDLTGTNTAFSLIASEILGVSPEDVHVVSGDTASSPQSGPAGGSMVTYTVGTAVAEAARGARQQFLEIAAEMLEAAVDDLEIEEGAVRVRGAPGSEIPLRQIAAQGGRFGGKYPPITAHGRSAITTQSPGFTVQLVEVAVDVATGKTEVVRDVVIQDVGRAINPPLVEAQMHGGATQGLGWALMEHLVYDEHGTMVNGNLSSYLVPEATQVPEIETILVENPSPIGPLGARGVGEPPIVAGPAAVANAVREAIGARITSLPLTPERVWRAANNRTNAS